MAVDYTLTDWRILASYGDSRNLGRVTDRAGVLIAYDERHGVFIPFVASDEGARDFLDFAARMEGESGLDLENAHMTLSGLLAAWDRTDDEFITRRAATRYVEKFEKRLRGRDYELIHPTPEEVTPDYDTSDPEIEDTKQRFAGGDEDFAARLQNRATTKARERRKRVVPTPDVVGELPANTLAEIPPVRLECVDAREGTDKFWEIFVTEDNPDTGVSFQVNVRFGRNGTDGQTRQVATTRTKSRAMEIRNNRIKKKRRRGYSAPVTRR